MNKKIEQQLNNMLKYVQELKLGEEEICEINKIGFLYSVGRMSPMEVALRLWYVAHYNVNGIYEKDFQNFIERTCRQ